jgi:hypothetical protein
MTAWETDLLADLIQQKRDCLRQLQAAGEKQLELVREGRITELLDLLAAKQGVLRAVERIEKRLEAFRKQEPRQRRWRSPERRAECARHVEECEALLRRIVDVERYSERELIVQRDRTADQLQGVHRASQARGAYADASRPGGLQIDLSSER